MGSNLSRVNKQRMHASVDSRINVRSADDDDDHDDESRSISASSRDEATSSLRGQTYKYSVYPLQTLCSRHTTLCGQSVYFFHSRKLIKGASATRTMRTLFARTNSCLMQFFLTKENYIRMVKYFFNSRFF